MKRVPILLVGSIIAKHCNANNIAMAVGVDAQVTQAFDLEVVQTAEQRNDADASRD